MVSRQKVVTRFRTIKTRARSKAKSFSASIPGKFVKGSLLGLGAKEVADVVLDQVPQIPEVVQAPITIGVAVGAGYWGGGKYGAIGGAIAAGTIEVIRFFGGGGGTSLGQEVGL